MLTSTPKRTNPAFVPALRQAVRCDVRVNATLESAYDAPCPIAPKMRVPMTNRRTALLETLNLTSDEAGRTCAEALEALVDERGLRSGLVLSTAVARVLARYGLCRPSHVAAVLEVLLAPRRAFPYTSTTNNLEGNLS